MPFRSTSGIAGLQPFQGRPRSVVITAPRVALDARDGVTEKKAPSGGAAVPALFAYQACADFKAHVDSVKFWTALAMNRPPA